MTRCRPLPVTKSQDLSARTLCLKMGWGSVGAMSIRQRCCAGAGLLYDVCWLARLARIAEVESPAIHPAPLAFQMLYCSVLDGFRPSDVSLTGNPLELDSNRAQLFTGVPAKQSIQGPSRPPSPSLRARNAASAIRDGQLLPPLPHRAPCGRLLWASRGGLSCLWRHAASIVIRRSPSIARTCLLNRHRIKDFCHLILFPPVWIPVTQASVAAMSGQ